MKRKQLPHGRRPLLLAALLAGLAVVAAPVSHAAADLVKARPPASVHSASAQPPAAFWSQIQAGLRFAQPGEAAALSGALAGISPARPWLSAAWSLSLLTRPAPSALFTAWLVGGVQHAFTLLAPTPGRRVLRDLERTQGAREQAAERLGRAVLAELVIEPVSGATSSPYGYRRDPFTRRKKLHKGVDYRADRGTPVYAAGPGVVRSARRMRGYGRVVYIDHGDGVETRYAHLQRITVREGDTVRPGERVGTVGSSGRATGPHLHFELRIDKQAYNPAQVIGPLMPRELLASLR
ncbi:M23 family metallopeptidase [Haliangium ochraceum]|uniref:Peptidase M23 n=1 Tax=Haliangium ochraceum (strain DSM 14365 / JCM 11303 / SMP-2) TaxID=502025 RepID=D0LYU2_HALO1|nr:M23 family metallopeptidase [Haliangium ochraceum]ACY14412.1 Peptidase M23 [Haliangium ochraceum DSM 14365]